MSLGLFLGIALAVALGIQIGFNPRGFFALVIKVLVIAVPIIGILAFILLGNYLEAGAQENHSLLVYRGDVLWSRYRLPEFPGKN